MRMTPTCLALAQALTLSLAGPALASDIEDGQAHFADHCAACHGAAARGDGPMAQILTVAPPDLTGLAAANGGAFPLDRVIRRIDGTLDVAAHGGPMPVFGLLLQGPSEAMVAPDGTEIVAPESLVQIAAWLQSVQE